LNHVLRVQLTSTGKFRIALPLPTPLGDFAEATAGKKKGMVGDTKTVLFNVNKSLFSNLVSGSADDGQKHSTTKMDVTGEKMQVLKKNKSVLNTDDSFGVWKFPTLLLVDKAPSEQRQLDESHVKFLMVRLLSILCGSL